jgi:acyl-CoA synthetase (AMP-forming)/AMP-acid ligase II
MSLETIRTLAGNLLAGTARPDRLARVPFQVTRYGAVPAVVGAMSALRFPHRVAVIDERGTLTFAELERKAAALATALRGSVTGDGRIGVLARNHRGFVLAVLGMSRLGHDVVLLNTDFSAPQLGAVAEREGIALLLHDAEFDGLVDESGFTGVRVHTYGDAQLGSLIEDVEPVPFSPERPGRLVIMTSGTTGTPKGARHDYSLPALLAGGLSFARRAPMRSGSPVVVAPPLFHVLGFGFLMMGLALGSPVVLSRRFDPAATLAAIERHQAGTLVAVPIMLQRMLDVPYGPRPMSLKTVLCGGSALLPHLSERFMDEFGDVLRNLYGATETGWATIATPADLRAAPGTVGRPSLGIKVKILDEDGRELPRGETGEICTGGGLRFTGYTGGGGKDVRKGLTATGDLGHLDAAGRLFVDGRADDMIVSGGENVFPGEVEDLLSRHEDVAEVTVTGVPDDTFGERLAAHVVLVPGAATTADDLRDYVKQRLARYKVPRDVVFVPELPRTSTGKVRRRSLPDA